MQQKNGPFLGTQPGETVPVKLSATGQRSLARPDGRNKPTGRDGPRVSLARVTPDRGNGLNFLHCLAPAAHLEALPPDSKRHAGQGAEIGLTTASKSSVVIVVVRVVVIVAVGGAEVVVVVGPRSATKHPFTHSPTRRTGYPVRNVTVPGQKMSPE